MKFGLLYIPDYHSEAHGSFQNYYEDMIKQVKVADELGFDGAWFAEHRIPGFAFGNPAVWMAALARETSRIRLGSAVSLLPLHNPIRVLEDYSLVDVLSGGRLNLGVGRGLYQYDYDLSLVDMAESRPRFDEALEIITKAWNAEYFSHQGEFYDFEDHSVTPRPLQKPHPPLYLSAVMSPDSYRWAGTNGHNLMCAPFFFSDPQQQRDLLDLYFESLADNHHDSADRDIVGAYHLYCGASEADVTATAAPALGAYQAFTKAADMLRAAQRHDEQYKAWKGFYENRETITFDQMRATRAVMGSPAECVDRIGSLAEQYGLNSFIFEVNYGGMATSDVLASLELFATEVVTQF